jgi:hypothetical protein
MFPLFRLGLGGKLGPGTQWWSWISLRDEVCALQFLLEQDHLSGPVNLTGPQPATNAEITSVMGSVLGRPTFLAAPAFALKAVLGEFSSEVLGSARVVPTVLQGAQFGFQDAVGRPSAALAWQGPTMTPDVVDRAGINLAAAGQSAQADVSWRRRQRRAHGSRGRLLDRGFQLYNPSYPEASRVLDHEALRLCGFVPGVIAATSTGPVRLGDPRRRPAWAPDALSRRSGRLSGKLRFALYAWRASRTPAAFLETSTDFSSDVALRSVSVDDAFTDGAGRSGGVLETADTSDGSWI